jgi:hypothetical protein
LITANKNAYSPTVRINGTATNAAAKFKRGPDAYKAASA